MATPFGFDLSPWSRDALQWSGAIAAVLMARGFWRARWHQALAAGLWAVPLIDTFWGIVNSLSVLLDPESVLQPISERGLWLITGRKLVTDLGYLTLGAMVAASGGTWRGFVDAPGRLAGWIARSGVPLGAGEARSASIGFALFPLLLFATIGADLATRGLDVIRNGQESDVWVHMTVWHALLLAASAAFGEELVYRGVLQTALAKIAPMWAAITLQAVLFGFAHSGYGTWAHLLAALAFGLFSGFVAWRWGLWAAIVVHFLIDVFAWGPFAAREHPWFGTLLLAILGASLVWSLAVGWTALRGRRVPA